MDGDLLPGVLLAGKNGEPTKLLRISGKTTEICPSADQCQISARRCHGIVWHRRAAAPGTTWSARGSQRQGHSFFIPTALLNRNRHEFYGKSIGEPPHRRSGINETKLDHTSQHG